MGNGKGSDDGSERLNFIKEMFGRYYSTMEIPPPPKLEQREFGVITERGGMWRHLGFGTAKEMRAFLMKNVPQHAYHSSTYYVKPNARTMEEKGWLGADLVFDLDADHIQGTEDMNMEEMFGAVKVQFEKLVNDFLLGDFGFGEKDVKIVFSGGRGYHAHVSNEKVLRLSSHERREIVDYITKPDSDIEPLVKKKIFDSRSFQGHVTSKYTYRLYPENTPGWKGKVTRSVMDFIARTERMTREEVMDELVSYKGIGDTLAHQIYDSLYRGKAGNRGIDKIRDGLNLEPFSKDSVRNSFINHIIKGMTVELGGETDEPVTSDVKRLIRLPGSLHGKTGFVVRTMSVDELKIFHPLDDAPWPGFEDILVVRGIENHEVKLRKLPFKVEKGVDAELPGYATLFFVCQKKAHITK